jgi:DNA-binding NarL/FixJ family response regulator
LGRHGDIVGFNGCAGRHGVEVLIVEDLRIFVDHVFKPVILDIFPDAGIHVVEDESSIRALIDQGRRFDVVLLDLYLRDNQRSPDLALLSRVCSRLADRVIVHSADADPGIVGLLKQAGAFAYIHKSQGVSDLKATLTLVLRGNRFFPPHDPPPLKLTPRQLEILALLAKGTPDKVIAGSLSLSVHTVTKHMKHLRGQFAVENRTALVLKFRRLYPGA